MLLPATCLLLLLADVWIGQMAFTTLASTCQPSPGGHSAQQLSGHPLFLPQVQHKFRTMGVQVTGKDASNTLMPAWRNSR